MNDCAQEKNATEFNSNVTTNVHYLLLNTIVNVTRRERKSRELCYKNMLEDVSGNWTYLLKEWEKYYSFFGYSFDRKCAEFTLSFWSVDRLLMTIIPLCLWTISLAGASLSVLVFYRRRHEGITSRLLAVDFVTDVLVAVFALVLRLSGVERRYHDHEHIWVFVWLHGHIVFVGVNILLTASGYFGLATTVIEVMYTLVPKCSHIATKWYNKMATILIVISVYAYSIGRNLFKHAVPMEIRKAKDRGWYWTLGNYYYSPQYQQSSSVISLIDLTATWLTASLYLMLCGRLLLAFWRKRRHRNHQRNAENQSNIGDELRNTILVCIQCTIAFGIEITMDILYLFISLTPHPNPCSSAEQQKLLFSTFWPSRFVRYSNNILLALSVGFYLFPVIGVDQKLRAEIRDIFGWRKTPQLE